MAEKSSLVLESSRLLLRPFEHGDLPAFFKIFSDSAVNRFLPWFPLKSMEEAELFWRERYALSGPRGGRLSLCGLPQGGQPTHRLCQPGARGGAYDLGYGLLEEFWHRGIMTEACRAVVRRAAQDGIPYVTATHDRQNPLSGRVMCCLGMRVATPMKSSGSPRISRWFSGSTSSISHGAGRRVYEGYRQAEGARWFVEQNVPTAQGSLL